MSDPLLPEAEQLLKELREKGYVRHHSDCKSLVCALPSCDYGRLHHFWFTHEWQPQACSCRLDSLLSSSREERTKDEEQGSRVGVTQLPPSDRSGLPQQITEKPRTDEEMLRWTLDNVYTIARRESVRGAERARHEMWWHVLRLCEAAGCQSGGVLR